MRPFVAWLSKEAMQRTERTAVFAVTDIGTFPRSLLSHLKHNRVQGNPPPPQHTHTRARAQLVPFRWRSVARARGCSGSEPCSRWARRTVKRHGHEKRLKTYR